MDAKNNLKRHTCIACKSKKTANKMVQTRSHWTCLVCLSSPALSPGEPAAHAPRVLNLYAGMGGNRKYWHGCRVTAVENHPKIAAAYKEMYPADHVIIGDAHQYLLENLDKFDIVWASPPCQSHSRLNYTYEKKRYPDLKLWQEIILLQQFGRKIKWVIENVNPYYEPFIQPTKRLGRHLFWSNCEIGNHVAPHLPAMFNKQGKADKERIMEWLGIYYEKNIYLGAKDYTQVFRNCVHPDLGRDIFQDLLKSSVPGQG
ncbi:MAG: DNA cytosine methyltransferase [Chitinophagaceae bacterium]